MRRAWCSPLLALAAGCATLAQPSSEDVRRASERWPGSTLGELQRGRALYVRRCAGCHNLHAPEEHPPERWPRLVGEMAGELDLDPGEQELIVRYLSAISARPAAVPMTR